jgi:DNA primase
MIDRMIIEGIEATPIEDVAERLGIRVERHKALCPFHDDSRPSLTFNTYRNRYRCYVCDAHGGPIDLVRNMRNCGFRDACAWLGGGASIMSDTIRHPQIVNRKSSNRKCEVDLAWLSTLVQPKVLNDEARRFLFDERHLNPQVVAWCGLSSISWPSPCWRYGKPFYDAPSLLIPYYDRDGRLMSVQSRYLGKDDKPRFKFPRGSNCHIYNLQILRYLAPNEELWITEGCSDCWAMLSSGKKAIAIPSATLLKEKDLEPLRGLNLHMFPDQDKPGEKLFLELRERLPQLVHHQLPSGFKDFGAWYASKVKS